MCAPRAHARTSRGSDRDRASAPHHGRYRGWYAACTTGARSAGAEKVGLLGLAKKTRFAAEHWEGQVHWESVNMRHHRGDQACAVDTVDLNMKCLDKYNMPQSGDVMVPVPQIQEQIMDVGGQDQVIVREIPEVLVVDRIQEQINDRYLEDVKEGFRRMEQALDFLEPRRHTVFTKCRSRP